MDNEYRNMLNNPRISPNLYFSFAIQRERRVNGDRNTAQSLDIKLLVLPSAVWLEISIFLAFLNNLAFQFLNTLLSMSFSSHLGNVLFCCIDKIYFFKVLVANWNRIIWHIVCLLSIETILLFALFFFFSEYNFDFFHEHFWGCWWEWRVHRENIMPLLQGVS